MSNQNASRFKILYDKLVQPLSRYIYYKCGDKELARDIVQDVFTKLWSKMDTIDKKTEISYCYTAAKHILINKIEKNKVRLKFKERLITKSTETNPHTSLEENELRTLLEETINNLPDGQREVFLMSRFDKLKYKEIALRLNISQKAVEKRMSLALRNIKESVENHQSR